MAAASGRWASSCAPASRWRCPPTRCPGGAPAERLGVARPDNEAHLRLYVEISGLAARGQEPFRTTAAAVARDWLGWTAARLAVPDDERHRAAAGVLAVLDGLLLTRFVTGEEAAQEAAMWLGVALGATSARHS